MTNLATLVNTLNALGFDASLTLRKVVLLNDSLPVTFLCL
jgi:hypothetical protein